MMSRPVTERSFEVQQYTGYATSRHSTGQWDRGVMYRFSTVQFRPSSRNLFMYDPTNPLTWRDAER